MGDVAQSRGILKTVDLLLARLAADHAQKEVASDHQGTAHFSRKIKADVFIDDRNCGGLPDWGTIYQMVTKHMTYAQYVERLTNANQEPKKKAWWKF